MPIYIFKNKTTGETKEICLSMKGKISFPDTEGNPNDWERVYTIPNMGIDTKINPYSSSDFVEKTRNTKGTIGDLFNASKELSEARGGASSDPVLKKYFSDYQKEKGVKHSSQIQIEKKEKVKEKAKNLGIKVKV
jgi:hypothetical protein